MVKGGDNLDLSSLPSAKPFEMFTDHLSDPTVFPLDFVVIDIGQPDVILPANMISAAFEANKDNASVDVWKNAVFSKYNVPTGSDIYKITRMAGLTQEEAKTTNLCTATDGSCMGSEETTVVPDLVFPLPVFVATGALSFSHGQWEPCFVIITNKVITDTIQPVYSEVSSITSCSLTDADKSKILDFVNQLSGVGSSLRLDLLPYSGFTIAMPTTRLADTSTDSTSVGSATTGAGGAFGSAQLVINMNFANSVDSVNGSGPEVDYRPFDMNISAD